MSEFFRQTSKLHLAMWCSFDVFFFDGAHIRLAFTSEQCVSSSIFTSTAPSFGEVSKDITREESLMQHNQ